MPLEGAAGCQSRCHGAVQLDGGMVHLWTESNRQCRVIQDSGLVFETLIPVQGKGSNQEWLARGLEDPFPLALWSLGLDVSAEG